MPKEYYVLTESFKMRAEELELDVYEGIYFSDKDTCIDYMKNQEGLLQIFKLQCEVDILSDINIEKSQTGVEISMLIKGNLVPEIYYVYTKNYQTHTKDSNLQLLALRIREGVYFGEQAVAINYRNAQPEKLQVLKIKCIAPLPITSIQLKHGVIISDAEKKKEVKISKTWPKEAIILSDPIEAEIVSVFDTPRPRKSAATSAMLFKSHAAQEERIAQYDKTFFQVCMSFKVLTNRNANERHQETREFLEKIHNQLESYVFDIEVALAVLIDHIRQRAEDCDKNRENKENNIYRQIISVYSLTQYNDLLKAHKLKTFYDEDDNVAKSYSSQP